MLQIFWKENINPCLVVVEIATELKIYITHIFLVRNKQGT
jgi:hypothetical protein